MIEKDFCMFEIFKILGGGGEQGSVNEMLFIMMIFFFFALKEATAFDSMFDVGAL